MKTSFFRNMLSVILNFFLLFIPIVGALLLIFNLYQLFTTGLSISKIASLLIGIIYFIGSFVLVFNLVKILYNIDEDPFVKDNVRRLKLVGYILTANAVFILLQPIRQQSMMMMSFGNYGLTPDKLIYFIIASVCFVIAEVFNKAIKIKEENDLTV
ncbi:DUF2975 domain-containing protein [Metaclostridioides mangenotii]|uniref:DUF2975 domain-containing protein n=1 Tax=Metaclostridioides mangenotii TaxID=1540 RepID=UPI0028E9DC41|nr:DUF2975 domain-containing protein [Clostridioides mangenotii]